MDVIMVGWHGFSDLEYILTMDVIMVGPWML